ncbi:hypothetical protein ACETU7_07915 [Rhodococcus sp. 3Y1]
MDVPGGWAGELAQQVIGNAQLLTALVLFVCAVRVAATRDRTGSDAALLPHPVRMWKKPFLHPCEQVKKRPLR